MKKITEVSVIGLGYIGLPTALAIATKGIKVHGVDINPLLIKDLVAGEKDIVEVDLKRLLSRLFDKGLITFSTKLKQADVFLICVQTPTSGASHEPDLSFIDSAARSIAPFLKKGNLVILESTVPVGTTERLSGVLSKERPDLNFPNAENTDPDIGVAYCPERVLPGNVFEELRTNQRIIGGLSHRCSNSAREFFELFVDGICHMSSNAKTAEMVKLVENSFRDVNIAFANEIAMICDNLDVNESEVIKLCNHHPRVNILEPGIGVGGHCIPVDPYFIVNSSPKLSKIIKQARVVNQERELYVYNKISEKIRLFNSWKYIICFGIAFKADVDDFRGSPAMRLFEKLRSDFGERVIAVDPFVQENISLGKMRKIPGNINKEQSIGLILVNHRDFRNTDNIGVEIIFDVRSKPSHLD